MHKKQKFWFGFIFLIVLIAGCSFMGFLDAKSLDVSFFEEKVHEVEIYDEDDLAAMKGSFYNNICYLKEDIVVNNVSMLASQKHPFIGVFDGQGHTIIFSGKTSDSLFGYIGEGGVVKNLHIQMTGADFDKRIGAILALENAGKIINCKITVQNATVSAKGSFAGVVAINRGTIKNAVVDVLMTKRMPIEEEENTRPLIIGAVCAYNYGDIFYSLATVVYEDFPEADKHEVFNASHNNEGIGAIYGINNRNGGVVQCVTLVEDTLYSSDQKDKEISFEFDEADVFDADRIFFDLLFDDELWILRGYSLDLIRGD